MSFFHSQPTRPRCADCGCTTIPEVSIPHVCAWPLPPDPGYVAPSAAREQRVAAFAAQLIAVDRERSAR